MSKNIENTDGKTPILKLVVNNSNITRLTTSNTTRANLRVVNRNGKEDENERENIVRTEDQIEELCWWLEHWAPWLINENSWDRTEVGEK